MKYLARRFTHAVFLMLAISVFSFVLLQCAPGNYFQSMRLDPRVSAQTVDALQSQLGMHRPFFMRYIRWILSIAHGNMGYSFSYDVPVAALLWTRARNTLLLTASATLLGWLLAIPLGIWSAASKGRWNDRLCGFGISGLLAIPDLLLFLILLMFAVRTGWFPVGGMLSGGFGSLSFWGKTKDITFHLALPVAGLALTMLPVLVRHIRSAVLDTLQSPFIRAARAHGIPRTRLLFRYALPAASNPLISLFGFSIATMLSGSAILEVIMSWPGLGPLMVQAILSRDVYVVAGIMMLASAFLVAGNLIADILLVVSDPRIRVG